MVEVRLPLVVLEVRLPLVVEVRPRAAASPDHRAIPVFLDPAEVVLLVQDQATDH